MNKRILSLILALCMVLGTISIASAATGNEKIDWLIEKGLVLGDEGGYRLNDNIRRSEVAAMVVRALDEEDIAETLKSINSRFPDMNLSNVSWARGYVNFVYGQGIVNGYPDGTFGPNRNITYAEIIKILVMVNGDIPEIAGNTGSYWALPYITKAAAVGITDGVSIPNNDYNAFATREKVFEMVYNTISNLLGAEQEVYKGIIVENSRVSNLDDDEVALIVLAAGDNAAGSTLRYKKDSRVKITLPSNLDAENLLGKVVDITIDKSNNAVKVTVDNTYTYYTGPITASEDEIQLQNGSTYDVYLQDRFTNSIDKIHAVYHNDEDFDYGEYVNDLDSTDGTNDDRFVVEFAKATVKGNRTFFIDSFTFDDIAPVVEVKRSGQEVYVYDDLTAAGRAEYNPDQVFGYTSSGFKRINLNSIKANDVIHVYDGDKAIVRQDAAKEGEFDAVRTSSGVYYLEIDGIRYQIRNSNSKRPVYSLDGNAFFTLMAADSSTSLADLRDEKTSFLLDLNNHVQLISGKLEFTEGVVLLDSIGTRSVDAVNANGTKSTYRTDNFSGFFIANSGTQRALSDFNRGDISYLFYDGNVINTLVRISTAANVNTNAVKVAKTSRGAFDINLNNSWIRLESGVFEYTNRTNVFIVEVEGSRVTRLEGTTMKKIADTARPGTDLRAFVISERDFTNMNVGNNIRYGNSANVAHTIIFTDYVLDDELLEEVTVEAAFNYKTGDDELIAEDINGNEKKYVVASFANLPDMDAGDIATLFIDDSNVVIDAEIRIDGSNMVYEVIDVETRSGRIHSVTIEINGEEKTYSASSDLVIFGARNVRRGNDVAFAVDENDEIIVISVY